MCIKDVRQQFDILVSELRKCGYLESEIFAIAKIENSKIDTISEDKLKKGTKVLKRQLEFAKKCLGAI